MSASFEIAFRSDCHATAESSVSVRYVQGGEKRDGFLTADVDTPFSVAEILESRPSVFDAIKSPRQATTVWDGFDWVVQPRRPAEVGARLVGMSCTAAALSWPQKLARLKIAPADNKALRLLVACTIDVGGFDGD